jgi:hypothetical protein
MFRIQHVGEGEVGKEFVCVAWSGPEELKLDKSMISPVETEVPLMILAKT